MPRVSTQEGLADELPRPVRPRALRRCGRIAARVDRCARRRLRPALPNEAADAARADAATSSCSASGSAARSFAALGAPTSRRLDRPSDDSRCARGRARRRRRGHDPRSRRPGRRRRTGMFVTFLSDFGLRDDFVGTCHGVIKRIAPEVQIVDITHGIPARAIVQGALVLANTVPYMPHGVHLAVVDPGVGWPAARARAARRRRPSLRRPGQRPVAARGRANGDHRRARDRQRRVRAVARLADVPRPRHLRARGRPPGARARARGARAADRSRARSSGSSCLAPSCGRTGSRRPCSTSTRSGTSS